MASLPRPGSELEIFAAAHNWKGYWSNIVLPYVHGSVLEVGAGIGSNVSLLLRHANRWVCLEPDAELFGQLEKLSSKSDVSYELQQGRLQDIEPSRTFDTILYIDVLEHIENDSGELRDAASRLKPQGTLVVLVPAHQFLFTPFDRTIGHFRCYNAAGLRSRTPHSLTLDKLMYLDSFGMFASLGNTAPAAIHADKGTDSDVGQIPGSIVETLGSSTGSPVRQVAAGCVAQELVMKLDMRLSSRSAVLAALLSLVIAAWIARLFFVLPTGQIFENQDGVSNVYMLIDFREALASGHWSPQWSTYMHGGLGDALFSYYQPGFFYLAGMLPRSLAPVHAIGLAVLLVVALGSFSMWYLVGARFGAESGLLAMTLFGLSNYAGTEVYVRGDYAELTAMMLLPLQLQTCLAWRRSREPKLLLAAAFACGAVVLSHAPVAVAIYLCLGLHILLEDVALRRSLKTALINGIPLLLGGLLASFYWFPVVFEWQLVQPAAAFGGFYLFSHHFVGLRSLMGRFADSPNVIPVALGPVLIASVAIAVFVIWIRRDRWNESQRVLLRMFACLILTAGFLMLRFSSPIWRLLPFLQRLQFPWRFLSLLSLGLAGIAATIGVERQRVVTCILIVLAFLVYPHRLPVAIEVAAVPASAGDLTHLNYAPDGANEWLPNGAHPSPPAPFPEITTSTGDCAVTGLRRGQSFLEARLEAPSACAVQLPHYYFPVGWSASLNGTAVPIENHDGWLAVRVPNGGRGQLALTFGLTPARRRGLLLSLVTVIVLLSYAVLKSGLA